MKFTTRLKKVFTPKVVIALISVIAVIVAVSILWGPRLVELFSNPDEIRAIVDRAGAFGPVVFTSLQTLQVVFAPVPANVTGAMGGAIFGWWGLPLTMVGTAIGIAIVTAISRKFGRPLVERFFSKKDINKFEFLVGNKAELALFLIFLLPFFPDDLVGYLAGLTGIRFRNIIIIAVVGRLPMQVVYNFFGGQLFAGEVLPIVIVLGVMGLIGVLLYLNRRWLYELVKADNHIDLIKQTLASRKKERTAKKTMSKKSKQ